MIYIYFTLYIWLYPQLLKFTGAKRLAGVDMSTRLCMTYVRVICVKWSKLNGKDNSYLRDENMSCFHRSVLKLRILDILRYEKNAFPTSRIKKSGNIFFVNLKIGQYLVRIQKWLYCFTKSLRLKI